MKILAKIKKRSLILGILFAILLIGIVYAATSYQINSGAQVTVDEWSVCQKVTNNNALAIFVPTNTEAEWTAFRTYASGVTYASCCSANGAVCSSDADCCSAICGTNADGDNYFSLAAGHTGTCQATSKLYTDCCDSDSRAYPGQTTYYDATNNCGSWDFDCDTVITKSYKCAKITSCSCGGCDETQTRLCEPEVEPCTAFYKTGTENYYDCGESAAVNSCYYTAYNSDCVGMYSANHIGLAPKSWAYGIGCLCTIPPEPIDPGGTYYNCTCK